MRPSPVSAEVGLRALAGLLPRSVADGLRLSVPWLPLGQRSCAHPAHRCPELRARTAPPLLGPKQLHGRLSRRTGAAPLLQVAFSPVALRVFAWHSLLQVGLGAGSGVGPGLGKAEMRWSVTKAGVSQVARLDFKVAFPHLSQDLTFGWKLHLFMKSVVKQKQ